MMDRSVLDRACEWLSENSDLEGEAFDVRALEVALELVEIDSHMEAS